MTLTKNKYKNLHTKSLGTIFYEYMKLGLWTYTGCLTGSAVIPYLLGDHSILDQLGTLSFNYMLGTLLILSISIGITLYKKSKIQEAIS